MNEILYGLAGAVGVPLVLFLWQMLLKRESVRRWGVRAGALCSRFLRQKLGVRGGNSLTARIKSTVGDFVEGLYQGMELD